MTIAKIALPRLSREGLDSLLGKSPTSLNGHTDSPSPVTASISAYGSTSPNCSPCCANGCHPAPHALRRPRPSIVIFRRSSAASRRDRASAITASSMATTRNSPVRSISTWSSTRSRPGWLPVVELSPTHTFIHAGVVGWKGRAILVPGKTLSGKTSLVVELVKAGATYYSDEFAVLDSRGRVHPFLLHPSVRMNGPAERQTALPIEEIGGWAGSKPLPVELVVLSEYVQGAKWRPRRLPAGPGALSLLSHTMSARHSPERALAVLERITTQAPVLKGRRGEAQAMAHALLATVESRGEAPLSRRPAGDGPHGAAPRLVAVNPTVPAPARRLQAAAIAGSG